MGILGNRRKVYREDSRSIQTSCDLYVLMDVLNLKQLEFLVGKGYKISGVFTNLETLELELATNMGRFRLLVLDSGCGNFGNSEILKGLNNILSLCIEGNKCAFLTSDSSIISSIMKSSIDNDSSLMVRDYNGIVGIYSVLSELNEKYVGSNSLEESLINCVEESYSGVVKEVKVDVEVGKGISLDDYNVRIRNVMGAISSGDVSIKMYDDIKY